MNKIRVAQRKRGGPITHRSQDRNLVQIENLSFDDKKNILFNEIILP